MKITSLLSICMALAIGMALTFMPSFAAFAQEVATAAAAATEPSFDTSVITKVLGWVINLPIIGPYAPVILSGIGFASALAAVLPKGADGGAWAKTRKFLVDMPAMNIWNAKNK